MAEIHRTSVWPVVVTGDGDINLPDKEDFVVRNGNFNSFNAEFFGGYF
jgi:hypothetical protein